MAKSPESDIVRVRPPRVIDAEQLAALNRELGYSADAQAMVLRIRKLSRLRHHFVAVAETEGVVAGWIHAEHRYSMETGEKAELVGLVVGVAVRRGGVGRLLVQAAEEWAVGRGLSSIVVRSNVMRPESHYFYRRIGYALSKTQHVYAKLMRHKTAL